MTSPLPLRLTAESCSPRSSRSKLDRVLLYGVIGLLMFGPLAFGAVESWSISVMQVGAGLLFALWAARQVAAAAAAGARIDAALARGGCGHGLAVG